MTMAGGGSSGGSFYPQHIYNTVCVCLDLRQCMCQLQAIGTQAPSWIFAWIGTQFQE